MGIQECTLMEIDQNGMLIIYAVLNFEHNTRKWHNRQTWNIPFMRTEIFRRPNTLPPEIMDGNINPIYNIDKYVHELGHDRKMWESRAHRENKTKIESLKLGNERNLNNSKFKVDD